MAEVVMAIGILFVSLLALARVTVSAFTDVAFARQRQTANQLANQLLEEVRGLPYDTVKKGMSTGDLAGDPRVVTCGTERYLDVCPPDPDAEKIVHTPGLPSVSPLVPHTGSVGEPDYPSTYSWHVYVTEAADAPDRGAYRITVKVSWENAQVGGLRNWVDAETLVYSPEGCVDTATHPFGAPCQPYFYGNGSVGGGGFITTGSVDGLSFDSVSADLYRETANAQLEQVLRVEGDATLPAVRRIVSAVDTYEGDSAVSTADTDPATSATGHQRATVGPQGPATLSVAGGGNELAVSRGGGSTGETISTTAASGANACNLQVDGLPCGFARGTAAGGLSHTLSVLQAGTAELVDVASSSSQPTVYLRRYVPGAGQVGLIREEVTWSLPEIQVGGLPSGVTPPSGWQGYWVRLTGFSATARAEAGVGTTTPTVSISGGQVQAWDGDGYQTVAVTTNGGDVPITPVDVESGPPEDRIGVEITGSVLVEPSSVAEVVTTGSTRTEGQARIGSPMVVSLNYRVLRNDVVVADVTLELNAGRGSARTIYRPTS